MKYLLNLPLALAALFQVWFASPVFMSAPWSGWGDGPSRGAMVLVMLEPVALAWILLLPVIAGSVFADAFDWLPVHRRWLQLTLVLGASALIGILGISVRPCRDRRERCRRANRGQTFRLSADWGRDDCGNGRTTYRHGLARLADRRAAARAPRRTGAAHQPHRPRLDGAHRRRSWHRHAARGNRRDPRDGGALPADGRRARGHDACRLCQACRRRPAAQLGGLYRPLHSRRGCCPRRRIHLWRQVLADPAPV